MGRIGGWVCLSLPFPPNYKCSPLPVPLGHMSEDRGLPPPFDIKVQHPSSICPPLLCSQH